MDVTVRVGDTTYTITNTELAVVMSVVTPISHHQVLLPQSSARALASAIMGAAAELPKPGRM